MEDTIYRATYEPNIEFDYKLLAGTLRNILAHYSELSPTQIKALQGALDDFKNNYLDDLAHGFYSYESLPIQQESLCLTQAFNFA